MSISMVTEGKTIRTITKMYMNYCETLSWSICVKCSLVFVVIVSLPKGENAFLFFFKIGQLLNHIRFYILLLNQFFS